MAISTSGIGPGQTITSARYLEIINLTNSNEAALAGKAAASHTHTAANITDFNSAVRGVAPNGRVTTTATTLTSSDDILYVDGAVTVTVGTGILAPTIVQIGTGQVTLVAGTGVILQGNLKTNGQWQSLKILPKPGAAGTFIVIGGTTATPAAPAVGISLSTWYPYGAKPDGTLADLWAIARRRYDAFMNYTLATDGMPAGMPAGAYRIKAPNQGFHPTFTLNATVSEGIGYGMMLTAWMGNPNLPDGVRVTNAQTIFNGLWTYYKYYRNANGLMNWHINPDGTVASTGGATDGDLDVAMALVIAHRQWGSTGTVDYSTDATTLINAIRDHEFTPANYAGVGGPNVMMNGDQWGVDTDRYMPDYFRPGFFREFYRHTGDGRWLDFLAKNYPIALGYFYNNFTGGVIPDGCKRDSTANGVEQYKAGYNASRWWGIVSDFLWNGSHANSLAHDMPNRMITKAKTHWANGSDVRAPSWDLNLAGPFEAYGNGAGDSMFGLASLVSSTHSTYASQILASIDADTEQSYFNMGVSAMAAIFMAGIAQTGSY